RNDAAIVEVDRERAFQLALLRGRLHRCRQPERRRGGWHSRPHVCAPEFEGCLCLWRQLLPYLALHLIETAQFLGGERRQLRRIKDAAALSVGLAHLGDVLEPVTLQDRYAFVPQA